MVQVTKHFQYKKKKKLQLKNIPAFSLTCLEMELSSVTIKIILIIFEIFNLSSKLALHTL